MTHSTALPAHPRLTSLDVFRGLTLAGMILVNHPGHGEAAFAPLKHAHWNGWTPTDLVFPSFLFIVGTAIALAFRKRLERGESKGLLFVHALRRSIVLFVLGLVYSAFAWADVFHPDENRWQILISFVLLILALGVVWPDEGRVARRGWGASSPRMVLGILLLGAAAYAFVHYYDLFVESRLRIPGVLQRIALCYLIASVVVLTANVPGRVFWTLACLVGYWAILRYVSPPAGFTARVPPEGLLHEWIDQIFGRHLYSERPDPEGLLSTLPAVATTLLGVLAGNWLMSGREQYQKVAGLLVAGLVLVAAGLVLDHWIPINKKIWTSSYVLLAGGFAAYIFGCCYALVDLEGWRRWAGPFLVLGTNAIAVYVASGLGATVLRQRFEIQGESFVPRQWAYDQLQTLATNLHITSPAVHSLIYSLAYVLLWVVLFWPLYRARVFIRV